MKTGRHRITRYTSIGPAKADVDAEVDTATTARYAWERMNIASAATPLDQ
jgi:hypothetical protein